VIGQRDDREARIMWVEDTVGDDEPVDRSDWVHPLL
jgi:hypothetical protein